MEILLLGMLMLKQCTIYEMRKKIEQNFTSMSSGSMGSIQAAIRKLLIGGMITFREYVENGVNKKVYAITETGREHFYAGIQKPMAYKEKSMELVKFFFMGMVESDKRPALLRTYITELEKELTALMQIKRSADAMPDINNMVLAQMQEQGIGQSMSVDEVRDIALFQMSTLELSITKISAELKWFNDLVERLEGT